MTNRCLSLEGSPFDLAIRGTRKRLDDSTCKATRLGCLEFHKFAEPGYLQAQLPFADNQKSGGLVKVLPTVFSPKFDVFAV